MQKEQSNISHHINQHACHVVHRSGGNHQGMVGLLNQAVCVLPNRGGGLVIAGCIEDGVLQGPVLLPEQTKGFVGSLPALLQRECTGSQHVGSSGLHSQQQVQWACNSPQPQVGAASAIVYSSSKAQRAQGASLGHRGEELLQLLPQHIWLHIHHGCPALHLREEPVCIIAGAALSFRGGSCLCLQQHSRRAWVLVRWTTRRRLAELRQADRPSHCRPAGLRQAAAPDKAMLVSAQPPSAQQAFTAPGQSGASALLKGRLDQ